MSIEYEEMVTEVILFQEKAYSPIDFSEVGRLTEVILYALVVELALANAYAAILATLSPPIDDGITRLGLQPGAAQPVMDASPAPILVYVHPPEVSPIAVFAGAAVATTSRNEIVTKAMVRFIISGTQRPLDRSTRPLSVRERRETGGVRRNLKTPFRGKRLHRDTGRYLVESS